MESLVQENITVFYFFLVHNCIWPLRNYKFGFLLHFCFTCILSKSLSFLPFLKTFLLPFLRASVFPPLLISFLSTFPDAFPHGFSFRIPYQSNFLLAFLLAFQLSFLAESIFLLPNTFREHFFLSSVLSFFKVVFFQSFLLINCYTNLRVACCSSCSTVIVDEEYHCNEEEGITFLSNHFEGKNALKMENKRYFVHSLEGRL